VELDVLIMAGSLWAAAQVDAKNKVLPKEDGLATLRATASSAFKCAPCDWFGRWTSPYSSHVPHESSKDKPRKKWLCDPLHPADVLLPDN
jgi:hypothetical protein